MTDNTRSNSTMARQTTDHEFIRRWVEERGGVPSAVKNTLSGDKAGVLYIDFPDRDDKNVSELTWEQFFKVFDEQNLAFAYGDDTPDGTMSRDCTLVDRNTGEEVYP